MDKRETVAIGELLAAHWPAYDVTKERLRALHSHFGELEKSVVESAINALARDELNTYPPSTAQIWGAIYRIRPDLKPATRSVNEFTREPVENSMSEQERKEQVAKLREKFPTLFKDRAEAERA